MEILCTDSFEARDTSSDLDTTCSGLCSENLSIDARIFICGRREFVFLYSPRSVTNRQSWPRDRRFDRRFLSGVQHIGR